ncbi:MAG: peptidase M15 [Deltaproteobacteria bacterium]|nr:peptidase M15 [Deltaproteobacteria bacterium]
MELSRNFSVDELIQTSTGLQNIPLRPETEKLLFLANFILQPIRDRWGKIKITSAFRCKDVNAKVGGAKDSQHVSGEAADIIPIDADMDKVFEWIVMESGINFGQAIRESKTGTEWIHISLPRLEKPNRQALEYDGRGYKAYV